MSDEAKYWRAVAFWMGDCHAATAAIFNDRKSASKSDVRRFRSIANSSRALLEDSCSDVRLSSYMRGDSMESAVIRRLADEVAPKDAPIPYEITDAGREALK
jgi:hypothetical protein